MNQNLHNIRHSLAHILAIAVLKRDPNALLATGPVTDDGFFYDIRLSDGITLSADDLKDLEKEMRAIVKQKLPFVRKVVSAREAREIFKDNPFKLEIINELEKSNKEITIYKTGDPESESGTSFTDLCEGGHVGNTSEIDPEGFALKGIAGAYWRGDEKNPMLTRISGYAFASKSDLDAHLRVLEEAKKRDHRRFGKELDLFTFSDSVGSGLPLWTEKGATIRRTLERFIVDEEIRRGYRHVITPEIAKVDLYRKSGHYPYYKESMYAPIRIDEDEFMLRPMTCPHHYELYLRRPHSFRELPLRYAEEARLFRYEQSGELTGIIRTRSFTLADAHIFCADETQAGGEVASALDLIEFVAEKFGLRLGEDYWYRLSLGDRNNEKKYFKDDDAWDKAEAILRDVLAKRSGTFVEAENEAAFYGPKIDIQMRNVNGKEDTAFTVQYDFVMPKRFGLTYIGSDGKEHETIVIHRSSIGAYERIIAFLLERYAGALPFWLSPVQARVLPIGESERPYAQEILAKLSEVGLRAELDDSDESLGKKIRNAKMEKIPYLLVIGKNETENGTVTLESRDLGKRGEMKIEEVIGRLTEENRSKTIITKTAA